MIDLWNLRFSHRQGFLSTRISGYSLIKIVKVLNIYNLKDNFFLYWCVFYMPWVHSRSKCFVTKFGQQKLCMGKLEYLHCCYHCYFNFQEREKGSRNDGGCRPLRRGQRGGHDKHCPAVSHWSVSTSYHLLMILLSQMCIFYVIAGGLTHWSLGYLQQF